VLEEAVSEWFEEDDAVPLMIQVFQIRDKKCIDEEFFSIRDSPAELVDI
jgi:hypothetical protein